MVSEFVHMNIKQECMDELEHELIPNIESSTISKDAPNSELDFEDKRESEESEQGLNIQREHVEPQVKDELSTTAETKAPGMSRNYYCVDCKSSTRNPRLYLQHRRDFHKESISIHECELCMYASKHSQKLARHFRTVHRDVFQSMAAQPGPSTNFISASEMIPDALQTVQAAKKTRLSTCRVCGLFAVSKTVLMDHIRSVHPELRIYECDQCEYSHYIRDRYNRHHRYHSMNHIRCQMCEFQTIYRWNLERHMRHHIDTISLGFRCNKCNFTASTKQSITAHEIAHHSGLNNQIDTFQLSNLPIDQTTVEKTERHSDEGNDTRMEEEGDFNASDFLNVVLADEKETSERLGSIDEKQEMRADLTEQRTKNEMKFFYCKNCNFRYAVDYVFLLSFLSNIKCLLQFLTETKLNGMVP